MKEQKKRTAEQTLKLNVASNLVLGVLVLSVGALCLSPMENARQTSGEEAQIYRNAENGKGVSLMFNVYWGTEEVYRILETLARRDVKATFFIGGCWADDNVECLKEIVARGHELGNHGYFHREQNTLDERGNREEILRCNQFIALAVGNAPIFFAPPSGAYSDATLTAAKKLNMKTILWSKDTIDWRDKDASIVYTRATKGVQAGAFVLMHPMAHTADALPNILKEYKRRGLSVITVGENLRIGE